MGNSLPVEDQGAQAAPEQDPGAQSVTEQGHGAQSLTEQGHGAQSLAEQDHGTQSVVVQDQSAPRASEPEDGATSGQEVSSPEQEAAGGYAAHVASPGTPASLPSLGSGRYRPPEDSPVAEVSGQPVVIADRCRCLGTLASTALVGGRWSSRASWWCCCLFGGSGRQASAARTPEWESGVAWCRACSRRGGRASVAPGVYERAREAHTGRPFLGNASSSGGGRAPADAQPFLWSTVFDRINVRFVVVGVDGPRLPYQGCPGWWFSGCSWRGYGDNWQGPTRSTRGVCRRDPLYAYYMPPRPPRFPEQEQQRPQQKLLIDQATITDNALSEWHAWLKLAQQGRSLREWGILSSDIVTAVQYLGEAPPQEEPATRGGRWHSGRGGRRKQQQQQDCPTSVGVLLYLKKALKCIDCFDRAPSGYHGLLLGPSSAMALERPDGGTASDEREAWKYIAASIAARVQRLLDKKRAKNRAVTEMTAIYLQTPKAAAAKPRPVQPRTPTTPAEDDSSDSSSGVSEVSGESKLEGEGVGEAIGVIRSCQDKGESLWTPGVVCRLFGTPEFPHKVFPEAAAMAEKGATAAPEATAIDPSGAAASSDTAAGTAAAFPAMAPPTPAATEPKSPASLASVIYRPGRLVEKTLLASDGSTVPLPPGVPPRHVLPQPPPPPSQSSPAPTSQSSPAPTSQSSPAQNLGLGQTRQEREFTLPAPSGANSSGTGTQFEDYESVVEAARAAIESASQQL